ncbi:phage antirepressor N-terminal domain-containing protein [Lonsdalea quercina]|uniref:phage antirepressor N-terminal domain-containing protein n=1 Tax=Lonsdalea quercina TaxID=71657 RepID=UPI0039763695
MNSVPIADRTINVPFYGNSLFVVEHYGEAYTPMRPIIDGMGMTYQGQVEKLKSRFAKGVREIMIPTKGGEQTMLCLALRKLNGWLQTISPNKVKPEIRDNVIRYQEECDDVLYEYWTKGEVKKPRKAKKALLGKITSEQQEAIKQLVMTRGKALPKDNQAKGMITLWSSLKSHFGCSYKEISEEQFTEALSLAARVPLDGEWMPKEEAKSAPDLTTEVNNMAIACLHLDYIYEVWKNELHPSLKMMGSPLAGKLYDRIIDAGAIIATTKGSIEEKTGVKGVARLSGTDS